MINSFKEFFTESNNINLKNIFKKIKNLNLKKYKNPTIKDLENNCKEFLKKYKSTNLEFIYNLIDNDNEFKKILDSLLKEFMKDNSIIMSASYLLAENYIDKIENEINQREEPKLSDYADRLGEAIHDFLHKYKKFPTDKDYWSGKLEINDYPEIYNGEERDFDFDGRFENLFKNFKENFIKVLNSIEFQQKFNNFMTNIYCKYIHKIGYDKILIDKIKE